KAHRRSDSQRSMSHPNERMFLRMSSGESSKVTSTPQPPSSPRPRTRNWFAKIVLPLPAVPATSVTRSRGRPPTATVSNPSMPVATFSTSRPELRGWTMADLRCGARGRSRLAGGSDEGFGTDDPEHTLEVGEVAGDPAAGERRFTQQRGRREDALA